MSEEIIVQNCSPTLAGLKTGNLFGCEFDSEQAMTASLRKWNRALSCKGIRMIPMRRRDKGALVYIYRPGRLARDLSTPGAQNILATCGYTDRSVQGALRELVCRLRTQKDFPHEIGLFLSYPAEDVRLFIENHAKNYKFVGCWKVYCNESEAKKTFQEYKKCTSVYSKKLSEGTSILQLTVAT